MKTSLALCLLLATSASAFAPLSISGRSTSTTLFSTPVESNVNIVITGTNIDLTDSLREYCVEKLEKPFGKLQANGVIQDCEVHLSVNKNPKVKDSHKVEVTTSLTGTTIRTTESSPDMYASIDATVDRITRKLRKYKERRLDGWHGGKNMGSDLADALNEVLEASSPSDAAAVEEEAASDPYAPQVTKIKSFNLGQPMSLQEAIFALDYMDHDFFVFLDSDSKEINVVYKRNAGGVGLIQPSVDEE